MEMIVVSIRDRKSALYARPVFTSSNGVAIRSFGDEVRREAADNDLFNHPEDFDLYLLGRFNDETGKFICPEMPEFMTSAADFFV